MISIVGLALAVAGLTCAGVSFALPRGTMLAAGFAATGLVLASVGFVLALVGILS